MSSCHGLIPAGKEAPRSHLSSLTFSLPWWDGEENQKNFELR